MPLDGFLSANRYRAFPFLQGSTGSLPDGIVVDAGFIATAKSGFVAGNTISLAQIRREGAWFFFDFTSNAGPLAGILITFTRHVGDPQFLVEHKSAAETGDSDVLRDSISGSGSLDYADCDEPLWYGYLVTGDMADLVAYLPSDGTVASTAILEPALVQILTASYVVSLNLANMDRTRAEAPVGCTPIVWPFPVGVNYVNARCFTGIVRFMAGYNATIEQDTHQNAIILGAAVGAGAGQPCEELLLFTDEGLHPLGPLSGGPPCNTVLRSINGVGGPLYNFTAGAGVSLAPQPDHNTLSINVDMTGLALCPSSLSELSESL